MEQQTWNAAGKEQCMCKGNYVDIYVRVLTCWYSSKMIMYIS